MWTFAHVVAAILFGALAWSVSEVLIKPLFDEGFDPGWFAEVNAALGALCGWTIVGKRASRLTFSGSISLGFTATIMMVALCLFIHSFYDMIIRSMRREYDGPASAVIGVFELFVDHAITMSTVEVWGALLVGGILSGIVVGFFGRIWR